MRSKVKSDSKCLSYTRHEYLHPALMSCVRLNMLHSCPLLLCLSILACTSYRCCVWSIHVRNRAEIWKLLLWLATTSCVCCQMGHSSEGKPGCNSRASLERSEGVWVSLRAELPVQCLHYCWWSEREISLVWVWKIPLKKWYRRRKAKNLFLKQSSAIMSLKDNKHNLDWICSSEQNFTLSQVSLSVTHCMISCR